MIFIQHVEAAIIITKAMPLDGGALAFEDNPDRPPASWKMKVKQKKQKKKKKKKK
ncbi:MAG: hypothetical protein LQ349_000224 [Xanthoria aureola]|nr:MAG: hypothetical protein LQ349_000224 [Xanthoria aureola]